MLEFWDGQWTSESFFSDLYVRFFCNLFLTTLEVFAPLSSKKDKKSVSCFRTKSTVHELCRYLKWYGTLELQV